MNVRAGAAAAALALLGATPGQLDSQYVLQRYALAIDTLVFQERSQGGYHLEVLARTKLQEDVRGFFAGRFADIDQDHGSALAAVGHELAFLR